MLVRIEEFDDWLKVFVDGKLWQSGHNLSNRDWLELLAQSGVTVTSRYHKTDDDGEITESYPLETVSPRN